MYTFKKIHLKSFLEQKKFFRNSEYLKCIKYHVSVKLSGRCNTLYISMLMKYHTDLIVSCRRDLALTDAMYYHVCPSALEGFLKCNVKFTKLVRKRFPSVLSGFPSVLSSLSKCTVRFALYTVVDKCTECVSGDRGMLF